MMFWCDVCGMSLETPGGLAFSPPDQSERTRKYHVCAVCWPKVVDLMKFAAEVEQP